MTKSLLQKLVFIYLVFISVSASAQRTIQIAVFDSIHHEALSGVVCRITGTVLGAVTDMQGRANIVKAPDKNVSLECSFIGFHDKHVFVDKNQNSITILLSPSEHSIDEVQVVSSRTNTRIEDLPTKVEVLGQEEMDEEATIVPGNIGSILGDLAVITVQRTNPVNGNDAVRMQGLDYKYTQIVRDGLPLYDGLSGSLGVLAIPPLDLKQVEIVKGASSTLYGGGAIGGLIHFISRTPEDTPSTTIMLNQTSLNETNLNGFVSKKAGRFGISFFTGYTHKQAKDINGDGFTEVPEQKHFIFHPRFFYTDKKWNTDAGLTISSDMRRTGDLSALNFRSDSMHRFLYSENTLRMTGDFHFQYVFDEKNSIQIKSSLSEFERKVDYCSFLLNAQQISGYNEIHFLHKAIRNNVVSGVNWTNEQIHILPSDSISFSDYTYHTLGFFSQDDYKLTSQLTIEAGIRIDHHNRFGNFVLPAFGIFYKPNTDVSIRLHYGKGYKAPNLFSTAQPQDFRTLQPIQTNIQSEISQGYNCDINYRFLAWGKLSCSINQAFYYTEVMNPTILYPQNYFSISLINAPYTIHSIGSDSYVRLQYDEMELYVGYNHTQATQNYTDQNWNMPFNPKDKFAVTWVVEEEGLWRAGLEASYLANQYITNRLTENYMVNEKVPNYWFFAGMIEYFIPHGSLVVNCENIGNYKQSNYKPLLSGPINNPQFTSVWGPLEGRVINVCWRIKI